MLATFASSLYRAVGPELTNCPPPLFLFLTKANQSALNEIFIQKFTISRDSKVAAQNFLMKKENVNKELTKLGK